MELLTQADYDALTPQLYERVRTDGPFAGRRITDVTLRRGLLAASPTEPTAYARLMYADEGAGGAEELLVFAPDVMLYPPGACPAWRPR